MTGDTQQHIQAMQNSIQALKQHNVRARQRIAGIEAALMFTPIREPIEFKAQYGEDVFAWELLGRPLTGFFIEAGAFDGYHYSTTYALECMGWKGILVEPLAMAFRVCDKLRTNSKCFNASLGSGDEKFGQLHITSDQYGGMLSTIKGEQLEELKAVNDGVVHTLVVPTTIKTISGIISTCCRNLTTIDFLSLDVEGSEIDALKGLDFTRHAPRLMLIEDNSKGTNPALHEFMKDKPYKSVGWLEVNEIYIRNDQAELFERLKEMEM